MTVAVRCAGVVYVGASHALALERLIVAYCDGFWSRCAVEKAIDTGELVVEFGDVRGSLGFASSGSLTSAAKTDYYMDEVRQHPRSET